MNSANVNATVRDCAVRLARLSRDEDLADRGDITAQLVSESGQASFQLVAKQAGVFAGRHIAADVLHVFDEAAHIDWTDAGEDGTVINAPPIHLGTLRGSQRGILAAERTFLNFLQRLSGIATLTRRYVDAVAGTRAKVLDTRKTMPGWRVLDKYAVRSGGGHNHRMGLYDAVLIKDNHLAPLAPEQIARAVSQMANAARALTPRPAFVEVEADNLAQVEQLLNVDGVDIILLDNFSIQHLRAAVAMRDACMPQGGIELEVSGGVTLDAIRAIAETGVERISVGAITHSAPALDLSLERT
jgi:nicotinate-nucleotide pyrophosphorylase (carboxylating)